METIVSNTKLNNNEIMEQTTKSYFFSYTETIKGVVEVKAQSEDEAFTLAQIGEGTIHAHKTDYEIGERVK